MSGTGEALEAMFFWLPYYLKEEDGGITVQKFLSSKTSLEDTSGAALASYAPKLGKKKMKKLKKAEREKNKGKDWFNMPVRIN